MLSAFESKTCIQCLSARRTAHAVSNDLPQEFMWTRNAGQNRSRACLDSHIRHTVRLVAGHANDASSNEAISITQHWIHLLCAQVAGHKVPKNAHQHDDSESNKSCSSCKKELPRTAFNPNRATCRWCLQRRKNLRDLDQQVEACAQQIWPDHCIRSCDSLKSTDLLENRAAHSDDTMRILQKFDTNRTERWCLLRSWFQSFVTSSICDSADTTDCTACLAINTKYSCCIW